MEVLKIININKNFGEVSAVADFVMVQEENEITGIIGPNGAGKTTVFNLIQKALSITDYAYVLETDSKVAEGEGKKIGEDPIVKKAYLGIEE